MMESSPRNTTCSKGHTHPPWNTSGILRIAKCETVCGFCQKETKTAANLRKHVAIHIKNERLNLTIAEGSSGRGRLEMPTASSSSSAQSTRPQPPRSRISTSSIISSSSYAGSEDLESDPSPSSILTAMSMGTRLPPHPSSIPLSGDYAPQSTQLARRASSHPVSPDQSRPQPRYPALTPFPAGFPVVAGFATQVTHATNATQQWGIPVSSPGGVTVGVGGAGSGTDLFRPLRKHNLHTREAWTAIPASEGARILDLCKSLSSTGGEEGMGTRVPCYNRETIFDEEWQQHMKDVHGVFLLWPDSWMRRVEVLDLEPFGGDIAVANDVIMDSGLGGYQGEGPGQGQSQGANAWSPRERDKESGRGGGEVWKR